MEIGKEVESRFSDILGQLEKCKEIAIEKEKLIPKAFKISSHKAKPKRTLSNFESAHSQNR